MRTRRNGPSVTAANVLGVLSPLPEKFPLAGRIPSQREQIDGDSQTDHRRGHLHTLHIVSHRDERATVVGESMANVPRSLRLLQIGNAPRLVGGTAACAWTVTRALPQLDHVVLFLAQETAGVAEKFRVPVQYSVRPIQSEIRDWQPDLVLLHNIAPGRVDWPREIPSVQYVHSLGTRAVADRTVYCSRWLRDRAMDPLTDVLYQAVPKPPRPATLARDHRETLVIGRICTPDQRKWPTQISGFYRRLARQFPTVDWEFVGCPRPLQAALQDACHGRSRFFPAAWEARQRLWNWDALLYSQPDLPESFGRTVAESLRAGCIPIVDHQGGFLEQLAEGGGFTCRHFDDFAAAVDHLHHPNTRRQLAHTAETTGDARFSLAVFQQALLTVFAAILRNPSGNIDLVK